MVILGRERKVVVQKLGEEPEEIKDLVETGTSTVPTFPRVLEFVDDEREMKNAGARDRERRPRMVWWNISCSGWN